MKARHFFIATLLLFGFGLMTGLRVERAQHLADRNTLIATQAESARLAATAAVKRLDEARQRGDALSDQLLTSTRQIDHLTKEKRHAVAQTTRGIACLGPRTLRLFDGAAGLRLAAPAEAASGVAAADGPVATDTDLATWIVDAGAQYEQCRQRLDRLIDWHTEPKQ